MHGKSNNVPGRGEAVPTPGDGAGGSGQDGVDEVDGWVRAARTIVEQRRDHRRAELFAQVRRGLGFDGVLDGGDDGDEESEFGGDGGAGEGDEPRASDGPEVPSLTIEQRLMLAEVQEKMGFEVEPVKIGRYEVLRRIDGGGMGVVYLARDPVACRNVALKRLHTFGDERDAAPAGAIRQEVRAMAALRHDNVVLVHDLYEEGPLRVIVMEYVQGPTLRERIDAGFDGLDALLAVFVAIAHGLQAIHDAGFFHGDLKLDNVIVDDKGEPRIVDFGMSARVGQDPVGGTLEYMARELLTGEEARASAAPRMDLADQYSFCVMLFLALAARHPYLGEAEFQETLRRSGTAASPTDVRRQYRTRLSERQRQRSIRWPDGQVRRVPRWLRAVLSRGLAPDTRDRYPTMTALAHALERPQRVARWRRRCVLAAGGLMFGAALMSAYEAATKARPCEDVASGLAGVWDDEVRREIDARDPAAARLLGAYVDRWVHVREDTCEATFVRMEAPEAVLGARHVCLDGRRGELATIAGAARRGEVNAFRAASLLRDPEPCAAVDAAVDRPPEQTREIAQSLSQLRDELRIAEIRGDYAGGRALADAAVREGEALRFFPLVAEARYERARLGLIEVTLVRDDAELRAAAAADLAAAIEIAGDRGEQGLRLEARIFAARIAAAQGASIDAPDSLLDRAERLGPGLRRQLDDLRAMMAYRRALAADEPARTALLGEAASLYEDAIAGHRAAGDGYAEAKAHENLGDVHKALGALLEHDASRRDEAWARAASSYGRAADLWRAGLGDRVQALGTLRARRIDVAPEPEAELLCDEADRWLADAQLPADSRRRVGAELALSCSRLEWKDDLPRARNYAQRALAGDLPGGQRVATLLAAAMVVEEDPGGSTAELVTALGWLDEADRLLAGLPDRLRREQADNAAQLAETRRALTERIEQR